MKHIAVTLCSLTLLFSSVALAQDRKRSGCGKRHQRMQQKAAELGITPATMQAIKQTFKQSRPRARALRKALRAAVLTHGKASFQAGEARKALKAHRQATRAQVKGMLTDQQWKAMRRMFKKRRPPLHRVVRKHAAELGLSEATVQAMEAEARTARIKLRLQRKALQEAVTTYGKGSPQASEAFSEMRAQRKSVRKAMRAYLTDQQVKQLRVIIKAKHQARRAKRTTL